MPYLLFLKKQQNLQLLSAANYRWRFIGLNHTDYAFTVMGFLAFPKEKIKKAKDQNCSY